DLADAGGRAAARELQALGPRAARATRGAPRSGAPVIPQIECRPCKGSGKVPVPRAYRRTLAALAHEWQTTSAIHRLIGGEKSCSSTALANRLSWRKRKGLGASR